MSIPSSSSVGNSRPSECHDVPARRYDSYELRSSQRRPSLAPSRSDLIGYKTFPTVFVQSGTPCDRRHFELSHMGLCAGKDTVPFRP